MAEYSEEDYVHVNALQHYVFCPRQCALIYIEDIWQENLYTVRGNLLHKKVDSDNYEIRAGVKTVRGLRIHSQRLGLSGRCDMVEFHENGNMQQVVPVEFKAGKPKQDISDEVQLCAQVLCLEEMLNTTVCRGMFFYGRIRRRVTVEISDALREKTEQIIRETHQLIASRQVPTLPALLQLTGQTQSQFLKRCQRCSLQDACQPKAMRDCKLNQYVKELFTP